MAYFGYARVSTQGQKDTSIEVQHEFLKGEAERLGQVFIPRSEKASGKNVIGREVFSATLKEMKQGDVLGVYDASRLSRNTEDSLNIAKDLSSRGISLQIGGQMYDAANPDSTFLLTINSAIATRERQIILAKSKASMSVQKKNGNFIFRGDLFGWTRHKKGDKTTFTIDETAAYYVRYCFREYVSGKSLHALEVELQNCHPNGYHLNADFIAKMLQKPIYMGKYFLESGVWKRTAMMTRETWESRLVKSNLYPAIIDEDLFWEVQEKWRHISRVKNTSGEGYDFRKAKHMLSGIYRCPECGVAAVLNHDRNAKNQVTRNVYGLRRHKPICKSKPFRAIHEDLATFASEAALFITFNSPDERGKFFEAEKATREMEREQVEAQIKAADERLKDCDRQLKNIKQSIISGMFSLDDFKDEVAAIRSKKAEAEEEIKALKNTLTERNDLYDYFFEVEAVDFLLKFFSADELDKRDMLALIVREALFFEDKFTLEFHNGKKFEFQYPSPKQKRKLPIRFKYSFRGEAQESGMLDWVNKTITLDSATFDDDGKGSLEYINDGIALKEKAVNDFFHPETNKEDELEKMMFQS